MWTLNTALVLVVGGNLRMLTYSSLRERPIFCVRMCLGRERLVLEGVVSTFLSVRIRKKKKPDLVQACKHQVAPCASSRVYQKCLFRLLRGIYI